MVAKLFYNPKRGELRLYRATVEGLKPLGPIYLADIQRSGLGDGLPIFGADGLVTLTDRQADQLCEARAQRLKPGSKEEQQALIGKLLLPRLHMETVDAKQKYMFSTSGSKGAEDRDKAQERIEQVDEILDRNT